MHFFRTDDDVELRLTRFNGGPKGPVILSPGFGNSGHAFLIDTVEQNFPEYLHAHGYDVWVLDYRASPSLESAADAVHPRRHREARLPGGGPRRSARSRAPSPCR